MSKQRNAAPACPPPASLAAVWGRVNPDGRQNAMSVMFDVAAELERIAPGMRASSTSGQRQANVAAAGPLIELILLRRIGEATRFEKTAALDAALAKAGVKKDKGAVVEAMAARLIELERAYAGKIGAWPPDDGAAAASGR